MSLSKIDTTRASRTQGELLTIVDAIYTAPSNEQETNWLEWKSSHNLETAEGRFAVAKAIIGFANRSVTQAQLACKGLAYMVVGVQPGAAPGFPPFDHAKLGQKLKKYADGPRWTPHYLAFMGVTVLVIVVEAPESGDPIHTLQSNFDKFYAGTIFHRGTAHTEPAGPNEVTMLAERFAASAVAGGIARMEALQASRHAAEEASQAQKVAIALAPVVGGRPGWEVRNDSDGPISSIEVRTTNEQQVVVYHGYGPEWQDYYEAGPIAAHQASQFTFRPADGKSGGTPDPAEVNRLVLRFTDASDRQWERVGSGASAALIA